jgi:hypothetical protein
MPHRVPLIALLAAAVAAGCGGQSIQPIRGDDAPAITVPNAGLPYEGGGADGSGADGTEKVERRGGIAAGPDSREPGDSQGADTTLKPPRAGANEP